MLPRKFRASTYLKIFLQKIKRSRSVFSLPNCFTNDACTWSSTNFSHSFFRWASILITFRSPSLLLSLLRGKKWQLTWEALAGWWNKLSKFPAESHIKQLIWLVNSSGAIILWLIRMQVIFTYQQLYLFDHPSWLKPSYLHWDPERFKSFGGLSQLSPWVRLFYLLGSHYLRNIKRCSIIFI